MQTDTFPHQLEVSDLTQNDIAKDFWVIYQESDANINGQEAPDFPRMNKVQIQNCSDESEDEMILLVNEYLKDGEKEFLSLPEYALSESDESIKALFRTEHYEYAKLCYVYYFLCFSKMSDYFMGLESIVDTYEKMQNEYPDIFFKGFA